MDTSRWIRTLCSCAMFFVVLTTSRSPGGFVSAPRLNTNDLQAMIVLWASGTPAIQQEARHICLIYQVSQADCSALSTSVRQAWLDLMQNDPAALGEIGRQSHPDALVTTLQRLTEQNVRLFGWNWPALILATHQSVRELMSPIWLRSHVVIGRPIPTGNQNLPVSQSLVWATSFVQTAQYGLPSDLDATSSNYVALPDQYVKAANLGGGASIPPIYQPFYSLPAGQNRWTVGLSLPDGSHAINRIPITDVGPWNEDDNWWDSNGSNQSLPATCPVASALVSATATTNPLVNGICPGTYNTRRTYYYLLYQHGLPFFQTSRYAPAGPYANDSAWPPALPANCAETVLASINQMIPTCNRLTGGYNGNHGAWLREGQYDAPILNQASIDLSPAINASLGWTWPSSGLIVVNTNGLP